MIDIDLIRNDFQTTAKNLNQRGVETETLKKLLTIDEQWRELTVRVEKLRAEQNAANKELSQLSDNEKNNKIKELKKISQELKNLEEELDKITGDRQEIWNSLPNLVTSDTPVGPDESANQTIKEVGERTSFTFTPKEHWELGKNLDIIDTKTAAKTTGSRFVYLKGKLAHLQFALIQHCLSILTDQTKLKEIIDNNNLDVSDTPFIPIIPPVMIRPEVYQRMARLEPKEERYHIDNDDIYLIGSAEHTLGPLHMDETLPESKLPLRYLGYSTSFRREAGSYGKDVRGILRVHQFDKLEMETFTVPEKSIDEQNFIVAVQEHLMQTLDIPYQLVAVATGDMADPDARQIDIEAWLPGQNKYRETHTSDLMTDYQSRRLGTRIKRENGENELAHMNDATAFAIGRALIAIMENYQQEDGSIKIPQALQKYVPFTQIP